ncbi:hypothetical protein [Cytobacillus praedii]|uniref:hypothetical protein n=1 Tax=Cytobacillus praedii TaxID=1742358 RepID=UPI002E1F838B|nr:hypothetical protein [Cytobacillus praedii]
MNNIDLKKAKGFVPYWALAAKLHVSESTLYRWFRTKDLPEERKQEILTAISELKKDLTNVN